MENRNSFIHSFIYSFTQTKRADNSNMVNMFNNNTYTDLRTAKKRILIPSSVI